MKSSVFNLSASTLACKQDVISIRRDLHAHPELAGQEQRTQQVILDALTTAQIPVKTMAQTGVVAHIKGHQPGPTLLLRSDMDALPLEEESDTPYRSQHAGCMHACGHDAHTAIMITAARILAADPPAKGSVKFAFQPAEERGAGAAAMIEDGLLADPLVDGALAFHVWTLFPVGQVALRAGPMMASVDSFELEVVGSGTHAANPEEGVDPIVVAAQIVTAAQSLVSRRIAPYQRGVVSFTCVQAGTTNNVIPSKVQLKGTIRSGQSDVREILCDEFEHLVTGMASACGAQTTIHWTEKLDGLVNDAEMVERFRPVAQSVVGQQRIVTPEQIMGGEDMALILKRVPGVVVFLGAGNTQGEPVYPHHHPRFDIDENVLPLGVEMAVRFAHQFCCS